MAEVSPTSHTEYFTLQRLDRYPNIYLVFILFKRSQLNIMNIFVKTICCLNCL